MPCGHAKYTREVGVCMATSGPGAIHLLNGLYDAKMDHAPVVAIVGQQARTALGSAYQQEVDLVSLFKDVASEFVQQATTPEQVPHLIDRAVRIAISERTVTCVILPHDLQELPEVVQPRREHGSTFSGVGSTTPRVLPRDPDLAAAAALLNAGERVAILIGQGAMDAAAEVLDVADRLGAGIAKALLGKQVLADDAPGVTGAIGLLERPEDLGSAWDRALAADRPAVVEAVVDPNVPPLPPHISWEQAKSFASSILRGDANALGFIKQTIKETVAAFTPSGDASRS